MEIGERGVSGAPVARLVNRAVVPGSEVAIHQLHSMVERRVQETQVKIKSATKMFHAQVTFFVSFFRTYVLTLRTGICLTCPTPGGTAVSVT